jgi:hypothetical protein
VVDTVVCEFANDGADLPGTVGLTVAQVPGELNVWSCAGERACASRDGEVGSSDVHARAGDVAARDRITQGDIGESAVYAYVAHCRES